MASSASSAVRPKSGRSSLGQVIVTKKKKVIVTGVSKNCQCPRGSADGRWGLPSVGGLWGCTDFRRGVCGVGRDT